MLAFKRTLIAAIPVNKRIDSLILQQLLTPTRPTYL